MSVRFAATCVLALALPLQVACSSSSWETEDAELLQQAIVNGEESGIEDDFTLDLYAGSPTSREHCTAALVAPNLAITALHCVAHFDPSVPFACRTDGTLSTPPPNGTLGSTLDPSTLDFYVGSADTATAHASGLRVFGTGSTQICRHDLALVLLDGVLEAPLVPLRLNRPVARGQRMRVIGYGANEQVTSSRRARSGVRVTDVGETATAPAAGSAAPDTIVLGEGACQGDSGGPAIVEETGALAGIYSISQGASCTALGVRNVYTAIEPFKDFILDAFEVAGYEPIYELNGSEGGADGSGGSTNMGGQATSGGLSTSGGATSLPLAGDTGTEPESPGSGSRRDPSCACRVGITSDGSAPTGGFVLAIFSGVAALIARRSSRKQRS